MRMQLSQYRDRGLPEEIFIARLSGARVKRKGRDRLLRRPRRLVAVVPLAQVLGREGAI